MCDKNFLAPTIGTALQARAHITDPRVDIRIVVTDSDALDAFHYLCRTEGIIQAR